MTLIYVFSILGVVIVAGIGYLALTAKCGDEAEDVIDDWDV